MAALWPWRAGSGRAALGRGARRIHALLDELDALTDIRNALKGEEAARKKATETSKAAAARLLDGLGDNGMAIGTGVGVLLIAIGGVWLRARKAAFVRAWDAVNADIDAQALGGGKTP